MEEGPTWLGELPPDPDDLLSSLLPSNAIPHNANARAAAPTKAAAGPKCAAAIPVLLPPAPVVVPDEPCELVAVEPALLLVADPDDIDVAEPDALLPVDVALTGCAGMSPYAEQFGLGASGQLSYHPDQHIPPCHVTKIRIPQYK